MGQYLSRTTVVSSRPATVVVAEDIGPEPHGPFVKIVTDADTGKPVIRIMTRHENTVATNLVLNSFDDVYRLLGKLQDAMNMYQIEQKSWMHTKDVADANR